MHLNPAKLARAVTSALVASALFGAVEASAGGVITTGLTSLGVNDSGELNFFGDGPGGSLLYGVKTVAGIVHTNTIVMNSATHTVSELRLKQPVA